MKSLSFFILLILFTSCTGIKSTSYGLENESYLEFIGSPFKYRKNVLVDIDNEITFKAEVIKGDSKRPKGKIYAIPTGEHLLTVSYRDEIIYKKTIFTSSQETKKIILP